MKKITIMLLLLSVTFAFAGCKEEAKTDTEKVYTVEWFKEHKTERKEQLEKCNSNPGELAATPNCVNASRADSSSTWAARGGSVKTLVPLTAKDLKQK